MDSVLGFTIANDLSERVLQGQDGTFNGNFTRAKSFDTFCPLGPVTVSYTHLTLPTTPYV